MTQVYGDRVADTTSTTGTGPLLLDGVGFNGYQSFADVCANGNTIYYSVAHRTLPQWEVGNATYGAGTNALTRTTVYASSNNGSAVNFSSGTKDIVASIPATMFSTLAGPLQWLAARRYLRDRACHEPRREGSATSAGY